MAVFDRIRQAWNAFRYSEAQPPLADYGPTVAYSPGSSVSQTRLPIYNEKTIINSIYMRLAIDVASVDIRHVLFDENGRYQQDATTNLNSCLTLEPNLDQAPRQFRQDLVLTLFSRGCAALVPVDTAMDPITNETVDIYTLRVGDICAWMPNHVKVSVYNEKTGRRQEVTLEKRLVAIIENPLYAVMNAPNSTLQRLVRKLTLLDAVDEQAGSGKLDLIIQLPYTIRSETKKDQAEKRTKEIEFQLKDSQYGIAYADATEKVIQLNRPAENNLLKTVEWLTAMLYQQLGITEAVMNGTADEKTMINYFNRTVEPIVTAIIEAMQRSFIGHTRTAKNERILYFDNPFKLLTLGDFAEIADKLTRNEVLTSNELRGIAGIKPSTDPKADELRNSNMPRSDTNPPGQTPGTQVA